MARDQWTPIRQADRGSNWGSGARRGAGGRRSSKGIYGSGRGGSSRFGAGRGGAGRGGSRNTYGRRGRRGGWSSLSYTRRRRLIRTGGISVLVVIVFVWGLARCGSDDVTTTSPTTTTARSGSSAAPSTTSPPTAPLNVKVSTLPRKLPAPHYQTGAAVVGGKIVIIGGLDADKSSTNLVWRFDPTTGATTDLGRIPKPQHDAALASVGTSVFAFGGTEGASLFDRVLVLKPGAANAVDAGAKLPAVRSNAAAVTVDDGTRALIIGGFDGKNPTNEVLSTTDGTTFTTAATLTEPVRYPAVAALGSTVWVFGGIWNDQSTASIQQIDLTTGAATVVGTLPAPLSHASAFVIDGSIFIAGGRNANGRTADISRFDPVALTTTPVAKLPQPITDAPTAVVGGTAYMLGGSTPGASNTIVAISAAP